MIPHEIIQKRLDQLQDRKKVVNKPIVFMIQAFPRESDTEILVPWNRETSTALMGYAEIGELEALNEVFPTLNKAADFVLVSHDQDIPNSQDWFDLLRTKLPDVEVFRFSGNRAWADAVCQVILQVQSSPKPKALLLGESQLNKYLAENLLSFSYDVYIRGSSELVQFLNQTKAKFQTASAHEISDFSDGPFDAVIGCSIKENAVPAEVLDHLRKDGIIMDAGIGTLPPELVAACHKKGISAYRLDIRAALSSVVQSTLETRDLIKRHMGRRSLGEITVVAGGIVGQSGDIVIDSIEQPNSVLGVADGTGGFKNDLDSTDRSRKDRIVELISKDF